MPCWTTQQNPLNISSPDPATLIKALQELGYKVNEIQVGDRTYGHFTADHLWDAEIHTDLNGSSVQIINGRLVTSISGDCRVSLAEVNRRVSQAYGRQVLQATAKRMGWTVKQTADNKFQIQRRY